MSDLRDAIAEALNCGPNQPYVDAVLVVVDAWNAEWIQRLARDIEAHHAAQLPANGQWMKVGDVLALVRGGGKA